MSDYEIEEALQLRHQRFIAALRFATTEMVYGDGAYKHPNFDEAIDMADTLIKKLEAPTR